MENHTLYIIDISILYVAMVCNMDTMKGECVLENHIEKHTKSLTFKLHLIIHESEG